MSGNQETSKCLLLLLMSVNLASSMPNLSTKPRLLINNDVRAQEVALLARDERGSELDVDDVVVLRDTNDDVDVVEAEFAANASFSLLEGDILGVSLINDSDHVDRNAVSQKWQLWPDARVPFIISSQFDAHKRAIIGRAMKELQLYSCVRFTAATKEDKDYIHILDDQACYSRVGRLGQGGQILSLGEGCLVKGIVMHELLHALGFWHEQSRPDRDEHVRVLWQNIEEGMEENFEKYNQPYVTTLNLPYDAKSLMHYDSLAFSRNNRPTLVSLRRIGRLGQRRGLTMGDADKLNRLYGCATLDQCKNEGENAENCKLWSAFNDACEFHPQLMRRACGHYCGICKITKEQREKLEENGRNDSNTNKDYYLTVFYTFSTIVLLLLLY